MRKSAILLTVALATSGLAACSTGNDSFDIPVGSCAILADWTGGEDAASGELTELPTVDCAEPHDMEAYASMQVEGDEFPGLDELESQASDFCTEEFDSFIGLPYAESTDIDINFLYPTEDSWSSRDDREIQCWAVDITGEMVTGTLKDANR